MNLTRITFLLALAATLFTACTNEQEVKFEESKKQYDEVRASLKYYRNSFDQTQQEYMVLREQYDGQPNKIRKDSLHTQLRENHDKLLAKHETFFGHQAEVLKKHDDLLKRLKVEGYPVENRIADFEEMNTDLQKLIGEYEFMNNEQNLMIDEQRGMLRTIKTPNLPTRPVQ
ncbi:MAG: hypothetical protein RIC19_19225 [Phaeodactylibacter sp.]|uniref:hypothetical protein n=1 Tax=Phaeodactylibacter sp. TaxID=1940289 RepID=UPI0032EEE36E